METLFNHWKWGILVSLALAAALAFAACGDDDEEAVGGTVSVQLSEFAIAAGAGSVPHGDVIFNVDNVGEFGHEFVVIRTDLAPGALPLADDGGIDESQVEIVGRIDTYEPGSRSATIDLDPGNYVLACNIVFVPEEGATVSHYENGMFTTFAVTE